MVLGRRGTVLNCSRRGIVWTWGSSSLLAWFVRSGTGWGMGLWVSETLNWIILFFNLNVAMHTSISCVAISNHMYDVSTVDTWVHDILVTRMLLHDILLCAGEAASSFFALFRVVIFGRVDTFSSVRLPLCLRYWGWSLLVALALSVCYGFFVRAIGDCANGWRSRECRGRASRPFAQWLRGGGCVHAIRNV